MQDSIGGNAKTVIVANISPSAPCAPETISTLNFAACARKIVNKVGQGGTPQGQMCMRSCLDAHSAVTNVHARRLDSTSMHTGAEQLHTSRHRCWSPAASPASYIQQYIHHNLLSWLLPATHLQCIPRPLVATILVSQNNMPSATTLPHQAVINEDHSDDVSLLRQKVKRLQQELCLARALAAKASTGPRLSDTSAAAADTGTCTGTLLAQRAAGLGAVGNSGSTGTASAAGAGVRRAADEAAAQQLLEQQAELGAALQLLGELGERNTELEQAAEYWQRCGGGGEGLGRGVRGTQAGGGLGEEGGGRVLAEVRGRGQGTQVACGAWRGRGTQH